MKNLKNLNPKNTENLKLSQRTILGGITSITVRMNATESVNFKDLTKQKRKANMKTILLALITLINVNYASADENAPVNFHLENRLGQMNVTTRYSGGDLPATPDLKICIVTVNDSAFGKYAQGCSIKKLKDTATELQYSVSCNGNSEVNVLWTKLSETSYSSTSKIGPVTQVTLYKYVGPTCDSDAVKQ